MKKIKIPVPAIIGGALIGVSFGIVFEQASLWECFPRPLVIFSILGFTVGAVLQLIVFLVCRRWVVTEPAERENLPVLIADFLKLIIKNMRYRKTVREDVKAELACHFRDELRDCKTDEEKRRKALELIDDFGDPKLLGVLLRRAKKRCRPLWRTIAARTFQTIGVLILCLIIYIAWFLTGKPVITTDYLAELNRIVRPTADENQNAASFYIKAAEMIEDALDDMKELVRKDFEELTGEEKNKIEDWLDSKKEVFELTAQGSIKPHYWRQYESNEQKELMSVLFPSLADFRRIAQSLCLRARLKAEKNNIEQAFDDIITCCRFGRHLKGDFSLIEQLVGIAIESISVNTLREILSRHRPDSASLEKLQSDLEEIASSDDFIISFESEKLFIYDEAQRCFTDGIWGNHLYLQRALSIGEADISSDFEAITSALGNPGQAFRVLFTHPGKEQTIKTAERMYDYYERISKMSPAALRAEGINVENEITKITKGNFLLEILTPAIWQISEINHRSKMEVYATVAIIAAQRYEKDKGHFPDDLNELVSAGYLKQIPIDSFSDKPLVYRMTDDGFTLYSVGQNFVDDGGVMGTDREGRPGMWEDNGDAVFWPVQK